MTYLCIDVIDTGARLGNMLFMYCAGASLAKRFGKKFLGMRNLVQPYRELMPEMITAFKLADELPDAEFEELHTDHEYVEFLDPRKSYAMVGYCQNHRLLDKKLCQAILRPKFQMVREIRELYGDISDKVCCHVRRGDYLSEYYRGDYNVHSAWQLREILNEQFPNDGVVFVSDDISWCKDHFKGERYMFADKQSDKFDDVLVDFYLQTLCKANVISNSTFSWMGAFANARAEKICCTYPWYKGQRFCDDSAMIPAVWTAMPKYDIRFDIYKSDKGKYLFCIISKVGCSSIMESILHWDFGCPAHTEKVFYSEDYAKYKEYVQVTFEDDFDSSPYAGYAKILVTRDPFDRMVSYINNTWIENESGHGTDYRKVFDKSLPSEAYVDCVLDAYPRQICVDPHATPQKVYRRRFGELFGSELRVVDIDELAGAYKEVSGHDLISNNVTKNEEKVCTRETLTGSQSARINEYIQTYE